MKRSKSILRATAALMIVAGVCTFTGPASASLPAITNTSEVRIHGTNGLYSTTFSLGSFVCQSNGSCTGGASGAYTPAPHVNDYPTSVVWRYKSGSEAWTEVSHPCNPAEATSERMCGSSWNYDKLTLTSVAAGVTVTAQAALANADGQSAWVDATTATAQADTATANITTTSGVNDGKALTGTSVAISAADSTAASGPVSAFAWDLDGNGTFETSGNSTVTTTWSSPGTKTVVVRVTSPGGETDSAALSVDVRLAPPVGEPGISINDGAVYTNSKAVALFLVWPAFATEARVSNDGGFSGSKTQVRSLATTAPWDLDDSVVGQFTKNVYVRFSGTGIDTTKTYSDDIILDTTSPQIDEAKPSISNGNGALALRSAPKGKRVVFLIRLKATDDKSGVAKVQVSLNKNSKSSLTAAYTTRLKVALAKPKPLWLRVQDGAGNYSSWRKISVPRGRG